MSGHWRSRKLECPILAMFSAEGRAQAMHHVLILDFKFGRIRNFMHKLCMPPLSTELQQLLHKLTLLITMTWCTVMTLSTVIIEKF